MVVDANCNAVVRVNLIYLVITGLWMEAIKMLKENVYDILFLDINMPVLSGVELMELQPNRPVTIVTTAHSDYALSAYQNDAVDYLLKPISLEKFAKVIEKAKTFFLGNSLIKEEDSKSSYFSYRVNGQVKKNITNRNYLYRKFRELFEVKWSKIKFSNYHIWFTGKCCI